MKKILFVTLSLGYGIGGSEKALIELIKRIDTKKYSITVLSLLEAPEKPFSYDGVKIIYGYKDFLHMTSPFREALHNFKKYKIRELFAKLHIVYASRKEKYDFNHIMWEKYKPYIKKYNESFDVVVGYGVNVATFFAIDKVDARKKVVWVNTDLKKAHINLNYIEQYYKNADKIVVDAESGVQRFADIYPSLSNKVNVVRNILDIDELREKANCGVGFADSYDGIRLLSVGRLTEAKAFHFAIEAAHILKEKGLDFRWYIIGFGELESYLKELAAELKVEDCVVFLGQQLNPYPFFYQTDYYVQTSVFEGSCITLEEAMAFCKPVVTTNFPAAFEKVIDGKNGYITKMNGVSVAEAIEKLLRNEEIGQNMKKYQEENPLTYDKEIEKFYNVIN